MSEVERIAREAVALCADLLRRYRADEPGVIMVRTDAMLEDRHAELGRRVLAWQDQLDQPSPVPRVWKKGDPAPENVDRLLRVTTREGTVLVCSELQKINTPNDLWTWHVEGKEHVYAQWHVWLADRGPLTEVIQDGSNPDGGAAREALNPFLRPGDPEPQPCRRECPPDLSDSEYCALWPTCTRDGGADG